MTNRNIAIYRLVENTDTSIDAQTVREQITEPYSIFIDFKQCIIDIVVAVDNDFDNGSFTVDTQSDDIIIKRSGNLVRLVVAPNYSDFSVDNIVNFRHNVDEEQSIPLLIRQNAQYYGIIVEPIECDDEENNNCCSYTFSYVAKNNRPIEKRDYIIRENVLLFGEEKDIITETELDRLTPLIDEVSVYKYVNKEDLSDEIYLEDYLLLSFEEKQLYKPLYYIFDNSYFNNTLEIEEPSDIIPDGYVPYKYISDDGAELISAYDWSKLPEGFPEDGSIGQGSYSPYIYIKVYEENAINLDRPRYMYIPMTYRIDITSEQYNELSEDCKNACTPVIYINRYSDDIEISAEDYNNRSLNEQYYYKPEWYMVYDNVDKEVCKEVVESNIFETYSVEGKYDYETNGNGYYREITAEEYDEYPPKGQNEYYKYQYICVKSYQDYIVNDIIDFVEYESLNMTDDNIYFKIYRYSIGDYIKTTRKWKNVNTDEVITDIEYFALSSEDRLNYVEIYEREKLTYDEYSSYNKWSWIYEESKSLIDAETYNSLTIAEREQYEEIQIIVDGEVLVLYKHKMLISNEIYENLSVEIQREYFNERNRYIPEETITPSKYNSLPVYGSDRYVANKFIYDGVLYRNKDDANDIITEDQYTDTSIDTEQYEPYEEEITLDEYSNKELSRSDYMLNSIALKDDIISVEEYNMLESDEQDDYELCVNVNYIYNTKNDQILPQCIIPINVKCVGGSYDFIINGMSKYKYSNRYDYETDVDDNIISTYRIDNDEEYIADELMFNLIKVRSDEINDEGFVINQLMLTSYGWLDSTFIDDVLDDTIFYRIVLSHKDVIGMEATIRVILNLLGVDAEYALHNLELDLADDGGTDDDGDDDTEGGDTGEDDSNSSEDEIVPSVELIDVQNNMIVFGPQGGTKTIEVLTIPDESAIILQYTGNLISKYEINGHTLSITVSKNMFTSDQVCKCKVINAEYPSASISFTLKQMGNDKKTTRF